MNDGGKVDDRVRVFVEGDIGDGADLGREQRRRIETGTAAPCPHGGLDPVKVAIVVDSNTKDVLRRALLRTPLDKHGCWSPRVAVVGQCKSLGEDRRHSATIVDSGAGIDTDDSPETVRESLLHVAIGAHVRGNLGRSRGVGEP